MAGYDKSKSVKENFPNIRYDVQKFFLPIEAQYHTPLFPDSQLRTEGNFDYLGDKAHRYALQKVYISLSYKRDMRPGDLLVIYRKGITPRRKAYESVVSTICVVDEVRYNFSSKEDYLKYCENRTVFSPETLNQLWEKHSEKLLVVKFIFIKSLTKRITLGELWSSGIIPFRVVTLSIVKCRKNTLTHLPSGDKTRSPQLVSQNHTPVVLPLRAKYCSA